MESNWVQLCNCGSVEQAHVIKSALNDHDIIAVIINKQDSAYLFGDYEIFVSADDVLKAKTFLNESNFQI